VPEGIEHSAQGFFGKREPVFYPFRDIANFDIQQGFLHVWMRGKDKPVIQEACAEPNFFPGFYLLSMLFAPKEEVPEVRN
jgi:hypothetical protein